MKFAVAMLSLWLTVAGCKSSESSLVKIEGKAQGTTYHITWVADQDNELKMAVDSLLQRFDESLSTYLPNSLVSRFNRNDPNVVPDAWFNKVFDEAYKVSEATGGAFDCTVAPLVNAWGFGAAPVAVIDSMQVDSLLAYVGYKKIKRINNQLVKQSPHSQLNFNAIAQGYSVDLLAALLEEKGIHNYLVELGGEVKAKGTKGASQSWKVGIDQPRPSGEHDRVLQAMLPLNNRALATSGNYRKFYEARGKRFPHILDPRTGFPAKHHLLSATVLATDCIIADAYATAFMVMGTEETKAFIAANPTLHLSVFLIYDVEGKWETYMSDDLKPLITKLP